MSDPLAIGLPALARQVAHDLARLDHGKPDWTRPRTHPDGHVYDVVIVGGGQSGLGAAFGLLRERISNILVIDENPAGYEGPWDTYARMITLRTPKALPSIELGIPSLTFRAYWEAQHGAAGWEALDKIPRGDWMAYLRWYRETLVLPVRNETRLTLVEPIDPFPERSRGTLHRLQLADAAPLLTRKVVLATGIQGGGRWHTPPEIAAKLPRHRYAHTSEPIDHAALAGKRIAILGAGASSFDNAQHALAEGVVEAHVFVRRKALPQVNPIRFMEASGMIARFATLDDDAKYRLMASFFARNQPPTNDTFARAAAYPGFRLHLGAPWLDVAETPEGVAITTPHGTDTFDFLILSTGLVTDPALRPELRLVADGIARWADRHTPDPADASPVIDAHPYLGPNFQLLPRRAEDAAPLTGLFAFNYSGLISLGLSASALSGLKYAIPKLVAGIADQLFLDDRAALIEDYLAYAEPEFVGTWQGAAA